MSASSSCFDLPLYLFTSSQAAAAQIEAHRMTTLDIGYPLYGAQFADNDTLIVTGGGGEGNNGIKNKMSHVAIKGKKLAVVDEFEFPGVNDSPTAFDYKKGVALVSMNAASETVKKGDNKHLKKFAFNKDEEKKQFKFLQSVDTEKSTNPDDYQKLILMSEDGTTAICVSSAVPSVLRVIDVDTLTVKQSFKEEEAEIKDASLSPSGSAIAYVTEKKLVLFSFKTKKAYMHERFTSNYLLSKVHCLSDTKVCVGVNLKNKAGILLLQSELTTEEEKPDVIILKTKKAKVVTNAVTKMTGLAVYNNSIGAIAGSDNSISIVDMDDFSLCKRYQKVHTFAVTRVVFSPDGTQVASVSAASTISVIKLPDNIKTKYTILKWSTYILIFTIVFSFLKSQISDEQWETVKDVLETIFDDGLDDPAERARMEMIGQTHGFPQRVVFDEEPTQEELERAFGIANVMPNAKVTVKFKKDELAEGIAYELVNQGDLETALGSSNIMPNAEQDVNAADDETETINEVETETITETIIETVIEATDITTETKIVIEEEDIVKIVTESIAHTD